MTISYFTEGKAPGIICTNTLVNNHSKHGNLISWKEIEKLRHEINTNYSKYEKLRIIAHSSVGLDNEYYIYYFENHGFDEYVFLIRVPNTD